MFCKQCEYPLWNLTARACPECGTAFKPSEFEFAPNSVKFHCPHCGQHYFGTDPKGLLFPREFDCVSCQRHITMDEMSLLPADGWKEEQTRGVEVPWTKRKKIGFWRAWFGTIGMSMTSPARLIRALPLEGQSRRAFWFAVLTNFCSMFVGIAVSWVLIFLIGLVFSWRQPGSLAQGAGAAMFLTGFATILPLLFFALAIFVWALAAHGILRLTGRTRYGARRTFDALCYANGANILAAIPCCGPYMQSAAWIWSGVSASIMLRETHRVNGFRAALAVFLPPIALVAALVAMIFAAVASSTSQMQGSWAHVAINRQADEAATAVFDWARTNGGQPPKHAVELVEGGRLMPFAFVRHRRMNAGSTTIAGVDLTQMYALTPDERRAAVELVISSLPTDMVAHRVGDIVFTYHGMEFPPSGMPDGRLWIAVAIEPGGALFSAARADSTTDEIDAAGWAIALADQNRVRVASGLPELPDISTLTAESPATSGP